VIYQQYLPRHQAIMGQFVHGNVEQQVRRPRDDSGIYGKWQEALGISLDICRVDIEGVRGNVETRGIRVLAEKVECRVLYALQNSVTRISDVAGLRGKFWRGVLCSNIKVPQPLGEYLSSQDER
jgi:hypothetical protein